jgi:hypothetical protein
MEDIRQSDIIKEEQYEQSVEDRANDDNRYDVESEVAKDHFDGEKACQ